jgi:hypothetical protein
MPQSMRRIQVFVVPRMLVASDPLSQADQLAEITKELANCKLFYSFSGNCLPDRA